MVITLAYVTSQSAFLFKQFFVFLGHQRYLYAIALSFEFACKLVCMQEKQAYYIVLLHEEH